MSKMYILVMCYLNDGRIDLLGTYATSAEANEVMKNDLEGVAKSYPEEDEKPEVVSQIGDAYALLQISSPTGTDFYSWAVKVLPVDW